MTKDTKGRMVALVICQMVISAFMITDIYVFITKESIIAKSFAAFSFIIFLSFLLLFIKSISK